MNVGIIILELNHGGSTYQAIQLAKELQRKKHEVTIFTLNNNLNNKSITKGVRIKSANFKIKPERDHNQIVGFILYCATLLQFAFTLRRLILSDKHSLTVLNPHDWITQWAAVFVKFQQRLPVVWLCNDVWFIPSFEFEKENRIVFKVGNRYLIKLLDRFLTHFINTIVVLDLRIQEVVGKNYKRKVEMVRSGVDVAFFKPVINRLLARKKMKVKKTDFIFLCFSIFLPYRRFEDAILALQKVLKKNPNKNAKLIIAGSDSYDRNYARRVRDLIITEKLEKRVELQIRHFSLTEKIDLMRAADVFIFPNEKQTWGLTVIEAMATGLPCIVSSGSGVYEIINDYENGVSYQVRNVNQLARRMAELMENPKLRKKIKKNARQFVIKNFSWEKFASHMKLILRKAQYT